jgi:hypothetical protein
MFPVWESRHSSRSCPPGEALLPSSAQSAFDRRINTIPGRARNARPPDALKAAPETHAAIEPLPPFTVALPASPQVDRFLWREADSNRRRFSALAKSFRRPFSRYIGSLWGPRFWAFPKGPKSGPQNRPTVRKCLGTSTDDQAPFFYYFSGSYLVFIKSPGRQWKSQEVLGSGTAGTRTQDQSLKRYQQNV